MKKRIGFIAGISGIVLTAVGLCLLIYKLVLAYICMNGMRFNHHSVGIIGGADGPTAVFVAAKTGVSPAVIPIVIAAGIVLIVVSWILRTKRKR